jgi:hypothetical protein
MGIASPRTALKNLKGDTTMKTLNKFKLGGLVGMLVVAFALAPVAYAGSASTAHTVTVTVPNTLSISADVSNFTLTMADFASGSDSDTQQVIYTIKSNNNTLAADAVMLKGKLGTLFTDIDLFANPGAYTKTAGNFSLTESAAGDIKILASDVNLAKKTGITGAGKNSRGTIPVDYKATSTAELVAGSSNQTLTITVVDA